MNNQTLLIKDIICAVNHLEPLSLNEINSVSLMRRIDTKYIGSISSLYDVLSSVKGRYRILEIDNRRILPYKTKYFDTKGGVMYNDHHNGKLNRYKVRKREYLASGTNFLEIKFKNNRRQTVKTRMETSVNASCFSEDEFKFIKKNTPFKPEVLELKLMNSFNRITLAGAHERLTMDFNLSYTGKNEKIVSFPHVVVFELKQEKYSAKSDLAKIFKQLKMQPESFSKYCMGAALLDERIKANRLKMKFKNIDRIIYESGNN